MKIKIEKNLEHFKTIMKIITDIDYEPKFLFTETGLEIYSTSTSVVLGQAKIGEKYFDEFDAGDEQYKVSGQDIIAALSKASKWIEISSNGENFVIKTDGFKYEIPIFYIEENLAMPQNLTYEDAGIDIKLQDIFKAVSAAKAFTDNSIELIIDNNQLKAKAEKNKRKLLVDMCNVEHNNVRCILGVNQLKIMGLNKPEDIKMFLKQDHPIKFEHDLEELKLTVYIAPIIEEV